ncbi:glycoside hydrolase family 30 protein [Caldicellulosiruptor acetigenus]|uniref:glycoside hydrolase family 30 protein n=1 Tax=Caldicellulosiruptor acetigenus TaxID=301953 RepID=UPI000687A256|nr:glycoside hydrolase family 30 beta sandwich domain-containing protein [Caldicellulosiruptor acetigenus]WAM36356.1 hypothetical protein OTK01_000116 [Caldicellulosiruptor acetigenus]
MKKRVCRKILCFLIVVAISFYFLVVRRDTNMVLSNVQASPQNLEIWLTTVDQKNLLKKQNTSDFVKKNVNKSKYIIKIDPKKKYQTMEGFGASLTDASAYLIAKVLPENEREKVLKKLFDYKEGIGISFLRQPMGASDYATKIYSYDDMPKGESDFEMKHFSINHDKEYIIPLLKKAVQINKQLKIMATPWSPPGWMKTTDSMIGGSLWPDCYEAYANYFVKFINEYKKEGIEIYAITPQNEPLYVPPHYPGMSMSAEEQAEFIKNYLGPAFKKNNIKTKILCYDHNWDVPEYVMTVYKDKEAYKYISGSAWHCYAGSHETMTKIHNLFPDKEIWFTEASGGEWIPAFEKAFLDQMMHVIRAPRNWAETVVWWNIALDENNGPTVLPHSTCRGLVKIEQKTKKVIYNVDYYTLGHISKFVKPGAVRIDSNTYQNDLENVAFLNPDKSVVLIISNRTSENKIATVQYLNKNFNIYIPAKAAMTLCWK